MNPLIVLPAIALVAILFVVLPVTALAVSRYRGAWRLRCPEDGAEAQIQFDAVDVARAELSGRRAPRVVRCSSWPQRLGCAQRCVASPAATWWRPAPDAPAPHAAD